jgi:DNA adenine methylase
VKKKINPFVQPILKWAGGKRQLFPEISRYIPSKFKTYYEPFLGGGAVLFGFQPSKAIVGDINADLINVYSVVKDNVGELIEALSKYKNEKDYFYYIRELDRTEKYKKFSNIEKAARIIYLNKTCYNGLFRVNSQGQFNVPFGNYHNPEIINRPVLKAVSNYFNEHEIIFKAEGFESVLASASKGCFVYMDPPYDPISDSSSFTGYSLDGFNREDQLRLKDVCDRLDKKGCFFLLSNSYTDFIRELYSDYIIETVQVSRNINSDGTKRGKINEVLVRNYDKDK